MEQSPKRIRLNVLDHIRGITVLAMVAYHTLWDLVYIHGFSIPWFRSTLAYIWQQSICWTFILLSGFCWSFGRKKWKRGLLVLISSILVSLVTLVAMPESPILFGVLTFLGSAMLLMIPLEKGLGKVSPGIGLVFALGLFFLTRNVNAGQLGFEGLQLCALPESWYRNLFTAYLGFPSESFFSSDYFSLLPWLFLYISGYYLYRIFKQRNILSCLQGKPCKPLQWLGKNALPIYLLHQPVIYGVLWLLLARK